MIKRLAASALILALSCIGASASDCWNNVAATQTNCAVVNMYLNGSNQAVAVTPTTPMPQNLTQWNGVALGSPTAPGVTPSGNLPGVNAVLPNALPAGTNFIGFTGTNPYLAAGVTAISGNAAGTTAAVVGTLAASVGKTTYICGFNVQAIGGTASVGPIVIAGLAGGSQIYQGSSSAAGGPVASAAFTPCVPASAANTAITITTTANATATAVDVNSWGFQQ